jgi:N-acetyl-anhydromuramyl-L-alanine amidase AmpD
MRSLAGWLVTVGFGLLAACAGSPAEEGPASGGATSNVAGPLSLAFATSASRSLAPRDLLVAIAKVEDGLEVPAERPDLDVDNDVPAAGPLQLRHGKLDTLRRGAELVSVSEVDLRMHADLALEAGALVLAEIGARTGARPEDLASWQDAIAEMSGFADAPHREHYVHQVYATLARGGSFAARDGEVIQLSPHDVPPTLTLDVESKLRTLATAQFPGAEWVPTSCANTKCATTRSGSKVEFVVIHDTEGNWNASVATLQNDPGKSVQYIVGTDGRTAQFVTEETTAYHAGNLSFNQRSVGIEHVGFATKPFAEAEYAASAKLVGYLLDKYKLPRDRAHVIGHDQIPNGSKIASTSAPCSASPKSCQANVSYGGSSHHTDPGIWEWPTFMVRFAGTAKCNDVTNLWNCSNDGKKAFRCVENKVEVSTCDGEGGCEVKPVGTDDVCHTNPQSIPPTPGEDDVPAGDGSSPPGDAPGNPTSPAAPGAPGAKGTPNELPAGYLPPSSSPGAGESSCAVSAGGSRNAASMAIVVGLAALGCVRRRKR